METRSGNAAKTLKLSGSYRTILDLVEKAPMTIPELQQALGLGYSGAKKAVYTLYAKGLIDRIQHAQRLPDGSRARYVPGTGKTRLDGTVDPAKEAQLAQRRTAREERLRTAKLRTHPKGRIVLLTDTRSWAWGGQIDGYGQRRDSSLAHEFLA